MTTKENPTMNGFLKKVEVDQSKLISSEKMKIGLLAALTLFVFAYMTWIYTSITQLNAEELTQRAGNWVEISLPEWRRDFEKRAIAEAPNIIAKGQQVLLDAPHAVRVRIEDGLKKETRKAIQQMESELNAHMVRVTQQHIDLMNKKADQGIDVGLTNDQKLEVLMTKTRVSFRDQLKLYLKMNHGDFTKALEKLDEKLQHLLTAKNLSEEERLHKEIIAASVVLVEKFHKMDDAKKIRKIWGNQTK